MTDDRLPLDELDAKSGNPDFTSSDCRKCAANDHVVGVHRFENRGSDGTGQVIGLGGF